MTYLDVLLPLLAVLGVCVAVILTCEVRRGIKGHNEGKGDS